VKICNEVKKYGFSEWSDWWPPLARGWPILEKGQKKILMPASVIWDQISEICPQKGQPCRGTPDILSCLSWNPH